MLSGKLLGQAGRTSGLYGEFDLKYFCPIVSIF